MKQSHVVVTKYAEAFQELHVWLRCHSSLEWPVYCAYLMPDSILMFRSQESPAKPEVGFLVDIGAIYRELPGADLSGMRGQLPLPYGLEAVR